MRNTISMTGFAASISACMGIDPPKGAEKDFALPVQLLRKKGIAKAEKLLIYNPDAIGMWLWQKYTPWFAPVLEATDLTVPMCTVLPSVTPVCFGTMYTGVKPEVHGIQRYEKHVIERDSLLDALVRAEKKTAVVAVENSSMAIIFGGRAVDYFILPCDDAVSAKARELILENRHDVILVYNQEYDDVMHRTSPESPEALTALRRHILTFAELAATVKTCWKTYDSLICMATDHGIHTAENGHGTHGFAVEEDLNICHFYGAYPGEGKGRRHEKN
ncbi:MAG: hypothetical protein RSC76_03100 [Oscillospiraceae bacterium]